ncbi:hypothetical protein ACFSMW_16115 [Virgibacillus halophilus]
MALTALLGTFGAIFILQRELNLTFVIWYLSVFALVVASNAIYVFYKKKKKTGRKTRIKKTVSSEPD